MWLMNACVCASELGGFCDLACGSALSASLTTDHLKIVPQARRILHAHVYRILRAPKREEGEKYASFCEYNYNIAGI